MRSILYALSAFAVIGLAYWAYNENYATQQALGRVDALHRDIGQAREKLGILKSEWAYLNRPDRLRDLVDLNYDSLQLMPLAPEHFGSVEQVEFPRLQTGDFSDPVDLSAGFDPLTPEVAK